MAKNFFQDMIRVKSEIRKEMGRESAPKKEATRSPAPEMKKEPSVSQQKAAAVPPAKPLLNQAEPLKEERSWAPMVENRVTRKADIPINSGDGGKSRPRYSLWMVAAASLVFLFFAVSYFFAKAEVTITPHKEVANFNENMIAGKENSASGLSFELIALPGEEVRAVEGGEEGEVIEPARGIVIIYNAYSGASQRLDINTRLEGSNGKIYKTVKALTVPGMKGSTPGSVEAEVYAAEPGPEYNSPPLDFQIFGFKGTPKYEKFYARSKGDLTGGSRGTMSALSDAQKQTALAEMKAVLQDKLIAKAAELTPEGFILFNDAVLFKVDSESFTAGDRPREVKVTVKGTLFGFLLDEKELTKKIADTALTEVPEGEIFIPNIKSMAFSLLNQESSANDVKTISFNLSGEPQVVWKFDDAKLRSELAGKSKSQFNEILRAYPNIDSADMALRPIWRRSFPDQESGINVIVNYPDEL